MERLASPTPPPTDSAPTRRRRRVKTKLPRRVYPTSISRYRECPRTLFYEHIQQAEKLDSGDPPLVVGIAVHAALARFFGLDPEARSRERLTELL